MALEARLKALMGEDTEIQEETVNRMVGDFAQNPADRRKYVSLMGFLGQIGGFDTMHKVTRLYYDNATSASEEYLANRGWQTCWPPHPVNATSSRQWTCIVTC